MAYYSCSSLFFYALVQKQHGALEQKSRIELPRTYNVVFEQVLRGGAEGIRTPGLISAIDALSQLSYSPSGMRCIV